MSDPWLDTDMRRNGLVYRWTAAPVADGTGSNLPNGRTGIGIRVETGGFVNFIDGSGATVRMYIPAYGELSTSVRRVLNTSTTASNIFIALVD